MPKKVARNGAFRDHPALAEQARERGLECLEPQWLGWHTPHRFRCAQGHEFSRVPTVIARTTAASCQQCREAAFLATLQSRAAAVGTRCLETQWLGSKGRYRFACPQGHSWVRQPENVSIGCSACRPPTSTETLRQQQGLARLQQAAAERSGRCVSTVYVGTRGRYAFECAQGHAWEALGGMVLRGHWCPQCAHRALGELALKADGLARLQALAQARGGVCLAQGYQGTMARYPFRCSQGHAWFAVGAEVVQGKWCVACYHDSLRLSLADAQATARERGGACLSTRYTNTNAKLSWQCHRGHTWDADYGTVRRGHWCRECASLTRITTGNPTKRQRYEAVPLPEAAVKRRKR